MGAVFEAVDQRLDTTVALKETLFADERLRKQFEREARLLARLHHPALPRVSDHFSEGDDQFLVMQYIAGDDLSEMMAKRKGPFPVEQVLAWTDQLLDALDYLHTQEPPIIHRDIKPQNLKLTARGQIILLDFGLAKGQVGELSRVTTSASIFGYTPNYAPLEQIQGLGTDARSDIYSLAATVYHLMTGVKPPDALTRAAAIVNGQPDPLLSAHEANQSIGSQVAEVLQQAMAQNREQRYRTAADMRRALNGLSLAATVTTRDEAATVLFPPTTAVAPGVTQAVTPQGTVIKQQTLPAGETTVVRPPLQKRGLSPWIFVAGALVILCVGVGGFYAFQRGWNPTSANEVPASGGSITTPSTSYPQPQPEPTNTAAEEAATTEEKKAVAAEKKAIRVEKAARAAETETQNREQRETPDSDPDQNQNNAVPSPPETPEDMPEESREDRRRKRRPPPGVVIKTLPDGTQIFTAPDGSRMVITPDGRRRVIRRGKNFPNRPPYP
jgi:hypothetical protein